MNYEQTASGYPSHPNKGVGFPPFSVSPAFNSSLTSQVPLESYDLDGVEDS
jgi:hypothetical protein